jgi:hypothetical protein
LNVINHVLYLFRTLNEAREIADLRLNEYNSERPHESLNNLTPEEYRLMAEKPKISKSACNETGRAYNRTIRKVRTRSHRKVVFLCL